MFDQLKKIISILNNLPDSPGIYLYFNFQKELIYVGKATSLRSRVRSYWRSHPSASPLGQGGTIPARPIEEMIHEVVDIKVKETESVLEAIILEAEYIKKFQPKYNVDGKDDKSWNYIIISKDTFPKVETVREREFSVIASEAKSRDAANGQSPGVALDGGIAASPPALRGSPRNDKYVFGPYPGLNTTAAMKLLRRMFRFSNCNPPRKRDLSLPSPLPRRGGGDLPRLRRGEGGGEVLGKPCFYYHLGQCPGVCTGEVSSVEYRRQVIRPLITFLKGKKKQVIQMFEKEMKRAGKEERYEDAARLRDQLSSLQRIQDIALLNKSFVEDAVIARTRHGEDEAIFRGDRHALRARDDNRELRIEGYDISNLGASEKVGSMVVFNQEGPMKSEYRKFIIKTVSGQSDVDSLAEVLERRLKHPGWPLPNVFLIDGGRPQVNAVCKVLKVCKVHKAREIPVIGIAKGPKRKNNQFIIGDKSPEFIIWVNGHQQLLIQVRDEAHRFAITFHRKRRSKLT